MNLFNLISKFLSADREKLKQLDNYILLKKINYGGMSEIYTAQDKSTAEMYALKILLPSAVAREERLYEVFKEDRVEHSSSLLFEHPSIVKVYKTGRYKDLLYIVMELIKGSNLQEMYNERIPLTCGEKMGIFLDISRGVQYLHKKEIVHNDINPKNIIVTPQRKAKLIDFGIAVSIGSRIHKSAGIRSGTPAYMAPEQIKSQQVDYRTDIYNLGVTFYELFAGATPFSGRTPEEKMRSHLNEVPPDIMIKVTDIDPDLGELIMKCIRRDHQERIQNINDVCSVLEDLSRRERKLLHERAR